MSCEGRAGMRQTRCREAGQKPEEQFREHNDIEYKCHENGQWRGEYSGVVPWGKGPPRGGHI